MKKVTRITEKSGTYEMVMEDATLPEVIKNGTIAWEIEPEWNAVSGVLLDGVSLSNLRTQQTDPIEFGFNSGDIEHKVRITPKASSGKINECDLKVQMTKKIGGKATAVFTAEGTVKLPKQETRIEIRNGKLESFQSANGGITADIDLSLSAAGGVSGSHNIKLPDVAISIPIRFVPTPSGPVPLPIPVSIDIGIQFVSQVTVVDAKSSATAKSSFSYNADAGFTYKGSSVESTGKFNNQEIKNGTFDSAANIGFPVDFQFGVAFPRVGLKIAGSEVAYVHTGFTTGSKLSWGPLCKSGYVKMVVEGGYELKVLGQTLAAEKKTFVEQERKTQSDGCPASQVNWLGL